MKMYQTPPPLDKIVLETKHLLAQKRLDEAHHKVQKSLSTITDGLHHGSAAQLYLLLSQIYATAGHYGNQPIYYTLALDALDSCAALDHNEEFLVESTNQRGLVALFKGAVGEARELFAKLREIAERTTHPRAALLSLIGHSKLHSFENDNEKAYQYALEAKEKLAEVPENDLFLETFAQLIVASLRKMDYSELAKYSNLVLETSRQADDAEKEIIALNCLAVLHGAKSDYRQAVQYFLDVLKKSRAIGYRYGTAHCLINIGTVYANLFNQDEALERYKTALNEFEDILNTNTRIVITNNIGNIYYAIGEPEKALDYFHRGLELANSIHYNEMVARLLSQISRALVSLGQFDEAQKTALQAQELIEQLGHFSGKQINLINLGHISFHYKDHKQAILYVDKGIDEAKRTNDRPSELRGYLLMAQICERNKQFEQAYYFQRTHALAQETFARERHARQTIDLEIKYAISEKEREIKMLQQENSYQAVLLEQAEKIKAQNALLTQANEELKQFAYIVSHDLKEPLRMMSSYIRILKKQIFNIGEDMALYIKFIEEGGDRMKNLLDDLLRYATIGKGILEKSHFEADDALRTAQQNLSVAIEESGALIMARPLPRIYSNKLYFVQLFQNLISNAIKFRSKDKQAVISIDCHTSEQFHVFSIADNGIGIPLEAQKRVFDIFQRLHKKSEYEGTGIGLSICQKVVTSLGGKIWLESAPGQGTAFYFTLPKAET